MRSFKAAAVFLIIAFAGISVLSGCAVNPKVTGEKLLTVTSRDGSPIAYGVRGQGETTVVFVHGWTCDHEIWQPQIEYFSRDYRAVWLDLAGHGDSGIQRRDYTMSEFGQDVEAVVNQVGAEKVILVGHSMGGPVVIEAAKLLGSRVAGIVGVDAFHTPLASVPEKIKLRSLETLKQDYPASLKRMMRPMFGPDAAPEMREAVLKKMASADQDMAISALHECIRWISQKAASELQQFSDKLHNINGAPTGQEAVPHESVVLIPGAGHFVTKAKPDEFNAALERIIRDYKIN